jgi:hypothetical protein
MAKQGVAVELFYSGAWNTEPAYTRAPIVITRGRGDEGSGQAVPASCTLKLDNRDGSKNPRNPSSPLFGLAGRNTPLRVYYPIAVDAFGRTASNGWGDADTGGAWSTNGGVAGDYSVGSGVGTVSNGSVNVIRGTFLSTLSRRDCTVSATIAPGVVATGNSFSATVIARRVDASNYHWIRVTFGTGGTWTASLIARVAAADTTIDSVSTTYAYSTSTRITAELVVAGSIASARIWDVDNPANVITLSGAALATDAGSAGVQSFLSTGNTNTLPVAITFDDFRVDDVRFVGEVAAWQPRRTVDFNAATGKGDAWTDVTANGVLRRLGQGASPLRSPLTRAGIRGNSAAFGVSGAPVAYWPCEDESGATSAAEVMGNAPPLGVSGDVQFAALSPIPASAPLPKFADAVSTFVGTVPASAYRSTWAATNGTVVSFSWAIGEESANAPLFTAQFEDDAGSTWSFTVALDGTTDLDTAFERWPTADPGSVTTLDSVIHSLPQSLSTYFTLIMILDQVGSDINWTYIIRNQFGAGSGGDTLASVTLGRMRRVQVAASGVLDALSVGHLMVHDVSTVDEPEMFANLAGHTGETADERLVRLSDEEGVGFILRGTAGAGGLMGVQRIATLVELFDDAEKVDQGILFDSRESLGTTYRTVADLYNQTAALTLDYAGGQIAPTLEPDLDDLGVRNDAEVKRYSGSSARVTVDTGPLSTQAPPDGVGRYDDSITVNAETDQQLLGLAGWRVGLGTIDEIRYPQVTVDLDAAPDLVEDASAIDIGDLLVITGLPADDTPDDARLIVRGYTETIGSHRRTITFNTTPARPYDVGVWDDGDAGRYDSAYSTLDAEFVAGTDTSLDVAIEDGRLLWVTGSGSPEFPFDILIDGVRLTVTAVAGSSSPQTFTVTQAPVNGVEKTIAAGTQVRVWRPARWAL